MDNSSVQTLLQARAFPHPVTDIELLETHISWVILTGDYAYKIKKPVDFGFLDFTTLAARRHFCQEELRLNRRFAPELYLEVVPVCRAGSDMRIGGGGETVDYAVKMRQFPQQQLLSQVAGRGELSRGVLRQLGKTLAVAHNDLPAEYPTKGAGTAAAFADALHQNFTQLNAYPLPAAQRSLLRRLQRWCDEQLQALRPLLDQRRREGRVKDCHGDLHLGNIALLDGALRFFDCIEFNRDFRVMDTVAELAFLTMDMQARGYAEEAQQLLNDYLEYRDDCGGLGLLALFRCHYALVRAKVNLLRHSPDAAELLHSDAYRHCCHYLALADSYREAPQRFVALMHGVSGTGKSTVADQLAAATGAVRLRSDVVRKRLFGLAPEQSSESIADAGIYSKAATLRTFTRLRQECATVVAAGFPCIVDATFLHRRARQPFQQLAAQMALPFFILHCTASPGVIEQRLRRRAQQGGDASEADVTIMQRQLENQETFSSEELQRVIEVDSELTLPDTLVRQLRGDS